MTEPRTAYHAGIWDTLLALNESAAAIRTRADGAGIRQQAAAEALETFAEVYWREALPEPRNPVLDALRTIRAEPGDAGEIECPQCAGRLHWTRDPSNGHVWGQCEADDCLRWMQ